MLAAANSPPNDIPTAKRRRWFRWQVSLRTLLLLTLLVGIGLTVYRWPFVETRADAIVMFDDSIEAKSEIRTTYRRGWDGKPWKHGVEQLYRNSVLIGEAHYYDGLQHGRSRRFNFDGQLLTEVHYREGQLHGPFRLGIGRTVGGREFTWTGSYACNLPHGEWQVIGSCTSSFAILPPPTIAQLQGDQYMPHTSSSYQSERELIVRIQNWQQGRRAGKWQTQSLSGDVLSTAEYRDDELVAWNDQPVVEQFWQWLQQSELNKDTKQQILASRTIRRMQITIDEDEMHFIAVDQALRKLPLVIYYELNHRSDFQLSRARQQLVPALCELACENGYAFDCRYGTLWLTPHVDNPAPTFVDRTGVTQIEFDAGSPQARDWLAEIPVWEDDNYAAVAVGNLLAGSSIAKEPNLLLKLTHVGRTASHRQLFVLPRRDAIGLALYQSGYVCERRGNQLLLRYPNGRPNGALFKRPLLSPSVY